MSIPRLHSVQNPADFLIRGVLQLVKKSVKDFFDKLQPPSILPWTKCCYPERLESSGLSGRRFIVLEAGLAPSSSPAALLS